jgi:hypothetical protein
MMYGAALVALGAGAVGCWQSLRSFVRHPNAGAITAGLGLNVSVLLVVGGIVSLIVLSHHH